MSYLQRIPKWYRRDGVVQSIVRETEPTKLESYHDFERRYVRQPMQIWMTFKDKTFTFTGTEEIPIDITGSFNAMFNYTFTATTDIEDDITLSDGTNTYTIHCDIDAGSTVEITEDGRIRVDDVEQRYNYDIEYIGEDYDIPFGVVDGNRKLMQIFTPTVETLEGIVVKFSRISGATDNLYFQLYELDSNLNPVTKIDEYKLTNSNLSQQAFPSEITIPFDETLDITKQYAFIIKRSSSHDNVNYFILKGNTGDDTLKYWDGEEWLTSDYVLYFKTLSPVCEGDLPVIEAPTGTITTNLTDELTLISNNLELDTIYARSTALAIYPLKEMKICLDDGTELISQTFKRKQHQYCYWMSITAEEIAELEDVEITELPFRVYLETEWHLQKERPKVDSDVDYLPTLKKGFPQSSDDEDENYWPNEKLDLHANRYGLFRREYRDDILPYEYQDTYPAGYPFEEEQDYWLEKRILEEYAIRDDVNNYGYLYDNDGTTKIVKFWCKIPGISDVEVYTYINTDDEYRINASYRNREKEEIIEDYLFDDALTFVNEINDNSEFLAAQYLNKNTSLLLYNIEYLQTQGTYPTHGLIKAEIFSYLGVIPTIKDMVDYCLIYDVRTWDDYVWSGDYYAPAVFRIDIPKPPSNFVLLTEEEIQTIIKRCKKVGTEVIAAYSTKADVSFEISSEVTLLEHVKKITLPLHFINVWSGACSWLDTGCPSGDPEICCPILEPLSDLPIGFSLDVGVTVEPIIDTSLSFSLDVDVGKISYALYQDSDTELEADILSSTEISGTGDSAYIQLTSGETEGTFTTQRIDIGD